MTLHRPPAFPLACSCVRDPVKRADWRESAVDAANDALLRIIREIRPKQSLCVAGYATFAAAVGGALLAAIEAAVGRDLNEDEIAAFQDTILAEHDVVRARIKKQLGR